ncbi:hypothetical protein HK405_003409 [Cladochytrium tenue]|nr:hypothetical protein HK405_003409 [Cladochytrium tenue]
MNKHHFFGIDLKALFQNLGNGSGYLDTAALPDVPAQILCRATVAAAATAADHVGTSGKVADGCLPTGSECKGCDGAYAAVAASGKSVRFKAAGEAICVIDRAATAVFAGFTLVLLAKRASDTYHLNVNFMVAKYRRYLALLLPTGFICSPYWWLRRTWQR